jgi:hypothetical protein
LAIWNADEWNFRISDRRSILVKSKEKNKHRVIAEDISTKKPLILELGQDVRAELIEAGKIYNASIKVYTIKSAEGVKAEFTELFQQLDVDRPIEDFIEATCCYPDLVRFELVETEE